MFKGLNHTNLYLLKFDFKTVFPIKRCLLEIKKNFHNISNPDNIDPHKLCTKTLSTSQINSVQQLADTSVRQYLKRQTNKKQTSHIFICYSKHAYHTHIYADTFVLLQL